MECRVWGIGWHVSLLGGGCFFIDSDSGNVAIEEISHLSTSPGLNSGPRRSSTQWRNNGLTIWGHPLSTAAHRLGPSIINGGMKPLAHCAPPTQEIVCHRPEGARSSLHRNPRRSPGRRWSQRSSISDPAEHVPSRSTGCIMAGGWRVTSSAKAIRRKDKTGARDVVFTVWYSYLQSTSSVSSGVVVSEAEKLLKS